MSPEPFRRVLANHPGGTSTVMRGASPRSARPRSPPLRPQV